MLEELAAHGLEMTLATFDTTLKRIRQKRNKTSITSVKSVNQPQAKPTKPREAPPVVEAETESINSVVGSHNPADLDEIIGSNPDLEALAKLAKRTKK